MCYRLVSRDNIEADILEPWAPILDPVFKMFNNKIIDIAFPTETQIFSWLDSRSRTKNAKKMTNSQSAKNGDPNKIYAVYYLNNDPGYNMTPIYIYSIKMIKSGDSQSIIITDDNQRVKTSFKKFNISKLNLLDRMSISEDMNNDNNDNNDNNVYNDNNDDMMGRFIVHSSKPRNVHHKSFEGIFPISQELGVGDVNQIKSQSNPNEIDNIDGGTYMAQNIELPDKPYIKSIAIKTNASKTNAPKTIHQLKQKTERELMYEEYMQYVSAIHDLDSAQKQKRALHNSALHQSDTWDDRASDDEINIDNIDSVEYDVIFSNPSDKWLDFFINKLEKVETYLRFLADGGKGQFNIRYDGESKSGGQHEIRRQGLIQDIHRILEMNVDMSWENSDAFRKISNLASDPILFDGNVYQVRFDQTLLTWHASYSQIIKDLRMIPSKSFCYYIIRFDLSDFFKQNQSLDVLTQLYQNLLSIYQISGAGSAGSAGSRKVRYVKKNPNIRRVTRGFG
jgi:hypothetical protein